EKIVVAVVVEIADRYRATPTGAMQAGFLGDVGEGAVAIIAIETIGGAGGRAFESRAAEQEDVEPAIVVEIEEGDAAPDGFTEVEFALCRAVDDRRPQAGGRRNIGKPAMKRQS